MITNSEYKAQHRAVKKSRGIASNYRCVACNGDAKQWAWIHDMDRNNVMSYMPMCVFCHQHYDHGIDIYSRSRFERRFERRVETARYYISTEFPNWISRTNIVRVAFCNNITRDEMETILSHLVDNNEIECRLTKGKRGRPGREYRMKRD